MADPSPLTPHPKTLHPIGKRNHDNVDVLALLWESHRLRVIALPADQLVRSLSGPSVGALGSIADALHGHLDSEPAVMEQRAQTEALLAKMRSR
jgi:hypothetical protein